MKTEKKIKRYFESISVPPKEKVLPEDALKAEEKPEVYKTKRNHIWRLVPVISMSLVVCLLLVAGTFTAMKLFRSDVDEINTNTQNELIGNIPEIDVEPVRSIVYYLPTTDGKYQAEFFTDNLSPSFEEIVSRYLSLTDTEKIQLSDQRLDTTDGKTEYITDSQGEGLVSHTPGISTRYVYFTGENIYDDSIYIGLINTLSANCHQNYIHIYINDVELTIGNELPEKGYSFFNIEIETSVEYPGSCPGGIPTEPAVATNCIIHVVDKSGKPVCGISVRLEYLSGTMYNYMPGYAMTGYITGTVTRQGAVGATYRIHAELLNANSYTSEFEKKVIYDVTKDVTFSGSDEVTIVFDWDGKLPDGMKKTVIKAVDDYGNPMKNYNISLFTSNGGQIMLGYTNENGEVVIYGSPSGDFVARVTLFDENELVLYARGHKLTLTQDTELVIIEQSKDIVNEMIFPE